MNCICLFLSTHTHERKRGEKARNELTGLENDSFVLGSITFFFFIDYAWFIMTVKSKESRDTRNYYYETHFRGIYISASLQVSRGRYNYCNVQQYINNYSNTE